MAGTENLPAIAAQDLQVDRDQALVARALPDETGAAGLYGELLQRARRSGEEVGPPIEHSHVHEPGDRVEPPLPPVRLQAGRKPIMFRWSETIEGEDPSGGGEFGRPDHIELQDIRSPHLGIEPLHVE